MNMGKVINFDAARRRRSPDPAIGVGSSAADSSTPDSDTGVDMDSFRLSFPVVSVDHFGRQAARRELGQSTLPLESNAPSGKEDEHSLERLDARLKVLMVTTAITAGFILTLIALAAPIRYSQIFRPMPRVDTTPIVASSKRLDVRRVEVYSVDSLGSKCPTHPGFAHTVGHRDCLLANLPKIATVAKPLWTIDLPPGDELLSELSRPILDLTGLGFEARTPADGHAFAFRVTVPASDMNATAARIGRMPDHLFFGGGRPSIVYCVNGTCVDEKIRVDPTAPHLISLFPGTGAPREVDSPIEILLVPGHSTLFGSAVSDRPYNVLRSTNMVARFYDELTNLEYDLTPSSSAPHLSLHRGLYVAHVDELTPIAVSVAGLARFGASPEHKSIHLAADAPTRAHRVYNLWFGVFSLVLLVLWLGRRTRIQRRLLAKADFLDPPPAESADVVGSRQTESCPDQDVRPSA